MQFFDLRRDQRLDRRPQREEPPNMQNRRSRTEGCIPPPVTPGAADHPLQHVITAGCSRTDCSRSRTGVRDDSAHRVCSCTHQQSCARTHAYVRGNWPELAARREEPGHHAETRQAPRCPASRGGRGVPFTGRNTRKARPRTARGLIDQCTAYRVLSQAPVAVVMVLYRSRCRSFTLPERGPRVRIC